MITGKLQELQDHLTAEEYQSVHDFVEKAKSDGIIANDWNPISVGRIERAIVLNERGSEPHMKEFHKIFSDIHITIEGLDKLFIGTQIDEVISEYDEDKDFSLVKSPTTTTLELKPIEFALIRPGLLHINSLGKDSRKIVFKLRYDA